MSELVLSLRSVGATDRALLWSYLQNYLCELSAFYGDEPDENGIYRYEHFDEYFADPNRHAYFIFSGETLAGFALLCPYSCVGAQPDFTMAEFTIFPEYRRQHIALKVVRMIFAQHSGSWEIKYHNKNAAAKALWTRATESYKPTKRNLNEEETVLLFSA